MKNSDGRQVYIFVPLVLFCAVPLFVGGPGPDLLRSFCYAWDAGHLFCFAFWAYLYVVWRSDQSFKRQLIEVFVLTFFLGGLTELIQAEIGREAAW
jgi:hypothetical protein